MSTFERPSLERLIAIPTITFDNLQDAKEAIVDLIVEAQYVREEQLLESISYAGERFNLKIRNSLLELRLIKAAKESYESLDVDRIKLWWMEHLGSIFISGYAVEFPRNIDVKDDGKNHFEKIIEEFCKTFAIQKNEI